MAWHNNLQVRYTYGTNGSQDAWAYFNAGGGLTAGWKKVKANKPDGVTNIVIILNAALANSRRINVFLDADNQITRAVLRHNT